MIDQAIAKAKAETEAEARSTVQVTLPTGRVVLLNIPKDMSVAEMLAFAGYIGSKLPASLAASNRPGPRIYVPE